VTGTETVTHSAISRRKNDFEPSEVTRMIPGELNPLTPGSPKDCPTAPAECLLLVNPKERSLRADKSNQAEESPSASRIFLSIRNHRVFDNRQPGTQWLTSNSTWLTARSVPSIYSGWCRLIVSGIMAAAQSFPQTYCEA